MYVRLEAKEKFQQLFLSDVTGGKVLQRNNCSDNKRRRSRFLLN